MTVSPEYGGSGMDASAACIVHEELSAADPAFCLSYLGKYSGEAATSSCWHQILEKRGVYSSAVNDAVPNKRLVCVRCFYCTQLSCLAPVHHVTHRSVTCFPA